MPTRSCVRRRLGGMPIAGSHLVGVISDFGHRGCRCRIVGASGISRGPGRIPEGHPDAGQRTARRARPIASSCSRFSEAGRKSSSDEIRAGKETSDHRLLQLGVAPLGGGASSAAGAGGRGIKCHSHEQGNEPREEDPSHAAFSELGHDRGDDGDQDRAGGRDQQATAQLTVATIRTRPSGRLRRRGLSACRIRNEHARGDRCSVQGCG